MPLVPANAAIYFPAHLGTPDEIDDQLSPVLGPDWKHREPGVLLRDLLKAVGPEMARECMVRLRAEDAVRLRRPAACALVRGAALVYDVLSNDRLLSFAPGALADAMDEVDDGALIELRCEHDGRLSHMVGRLLRLWDDRLAEEGRALAFEGELYDTPGGRDVAEEIEERLAHGDLVGVSVGVGGADSIVQVRQDGAKRLTLPPI